MVDVFFQVGTEATDAQPIPSLQPGRVPKVRNQQKVCPDIRSQKLIKKQLHILEPVLILLMQKRITNLKF